VHLSKGLGGAVKENGGPGGDQVEKKAKGQARAETTEDGEQREKGPPDHGDTSGMAS